MKYVKLIAKPHTWFKEGTEAYHYDSNEENKKRITIEEWKEMVNCGIYWLRGTWIAKKGTGAVENCGFIEGEEYFDGETGNVDEFNVEIVEEII